MIDRRETGGGDPDGSAGGAGGRAPRGIDWREIARIGLRTLWFYLLLLAILLLWHGGGLFIYENF
ncbi:MAG TPA: hypothetical protein VHT91_23680 [Kofleriaceae bacterium]|nr:hypothetical protein [Kofleriaceae bacterium]